jgi:hypothetical protein
VFSNSDKKNTSKEDAWKEISFHMWGVEKKMTSSFAQCRRERNVSKPIFHAKVCKLNYISHILYFFEESRLMKSLYRVLNQPTYYYKIWNERYASVRNPHID